MKFYIRDIRRKLAVKIFDFGLCASTSPLKCLNLPELAPLARDHGRQGYGLANCQIPRKARSNWFGAPKGGGHEAAIGAND